MSTRTAETTGTLFPTPFCRAYWQQALREMKDTRMILFAALMVALRVALKSLSIPIAANLRIGLGFFVNAFGAMVYGPVVAVLGAAVSDTLGALLFPSGPYFFPFILTEIAGSLVFALFLYRTRVTVTRVMLSRFCIDLFVNLVLQTPIMWWYYQVMLGKNYAIFDGLRIVKNLVMFPIESVLLTLFLRLVIPPMKKLGYLKSESDGLLFTRKNVITLIVLAVVGVTAVALYVALK